MSEFDLQGLAQVAISIDIPAHKRIAESAIEEITTLHQQLQAMQDERDEALARVAELEPNARRYRFFKKNQAWRRVEARFDEPGYDFIGLKFDLHNGFTAKVHLDHAIDQLLHRKADEIEKDNGA